MEAGRRAGGPSQHRRRTDDPDVDEPRSGIFKGLCDRPYGLRRHRVAVGVEQVGTGGAELRELLAAVLVVFDEAHKYLGGIYWARKEYGRAADEIEQWVTGTRGISAG